MNISKEERKQVINEYINDLMIEKYILLDECNSIKLEYNKYKKNMIKVDYINNAIKKLEQELECL